MHNRVVTGSATDSALAHLSAAQAYEMWLPRLPSWLPDLLVLPPGSRRPQRAGVYTFRSRAGLADTRVVGDARVVSPEVCLGQLAEDLRLLDLVMAVDSALRRRLCSVEDIARRQDARQRGLPTLRQALAWCDGRSDSPWETVLRLLHVSAGVDVEPQGPVTDKTGLVIAAADLQIRGTRRLSEYDGAAHRERAQHQDDLGREKALSRADWDRYGYTAKEILADPERVLRDAEEALGWPPDAGRLELWRTLVGESSLMPRGRAMLADRLRRFVRPPRARKPRR